VFTANARRERPNWGLARGPNESRNNHRGLFDPVGSFKPPRHKGCNEILDKTMRMSSCSHLSPPFRRLGERSILAVLKVVRALQLCDNVC
jgi:hypothetical protein